MKKTKKDSIKSSIRCAIATAKIFKALSGFTGLESVGILEAVKHIILTPGGTENDRVQ